MVRRRLRLLRESLRCIYLADRRFVASACSHANQTLIEATDIALPGP